MLWLILQELKSRNPEKRLHAVSRLAEMESVRALRGLAMAVADADVRVRVAGLAALRGVCDPKATELQLRALNDPEPEVRQAAIRHLRDEGNDEVYAAVAGALRDAHPGVRGNAAHYLERSSWHPKDADDEAWMAIGSGRFMLAASLGGAAIQPLERVLQGEGFSQQAAAVEALGTIPDERVFKAIKIALKSPDHVVCLAAISALGNAGGANVMGDIVKLLKHRDARIRSAVIEALARHDLTNHGQTLLEALRDAAWEVRVAVVTALGKLKDPTTVDALATVLKDQSVDVRVAAAAAIGSIGDARGIGPLVLALKDADSEVRKMAGGALTRIDTKWAESDAARKLAPELRSALASGDWAVRRAASYVLEQLGARQTPSGEHTDTSIATPARRRQQAVLTAFEDLLRDTDADLRLAAVESLGRLGDALARSPLMTALTDTDKAVRLAAAQALADLGVV